MARPERAYARTHPDDPWADPAGASVRVSALTPRHAAPMLALLGLGLAPAALAFLAEAGAVICAAAAGLRRRKGRSRERKGASSNLRSKKSELFLKTLNEE